MRDRSVIRELAQEHLSRNDPTGWFEALYRKAGGDPGVVPWADLAPNPNLVQWLTPHPARPVASAVPAGP